MLDYAVRLLAVGHLRFARDWNLDFNSSTVKNLLREYRCVCKIEPIFISSAAECPISEADETAGRNDGVNELFEYVCHPWHLPNQASVHLIMCLCDR